MSLEQLFQTAELNVVVPDTSLEFPPASTTDEWLGRVKISKVERKQAFFDEQLQSLLLFRVKHPIPGIPADPNNPPIILLEFLNYVQVSLEASYISPVPIAPTAMDTPRSSRLSAPPRSSSLAKSSGLLTVHHPSIYPPNTPNPMPATGEYDRKYVSSEGPLLLANVWGANTADDSREAFTLLWSEKEKVWVALYRLSLTVSFLRLNFSNPLLCLTVSATLREKPIITSEKHPLAKFFESIGVFAPESPAVLDNETSREPEEQLLDGLEEVNLLEGLLAAPLFAKMGPEELNLPTLRLGPISRQKLFSLPPVLVETPTAPSPSPMTAVRKAHPTLRKSYRRTMQTLSGFRVRMRTTFVPYVLLPDTEGIISDLDEEEKERERREAGSAERTVVLCVEIENSGESGTGAGFVVEKVDVTIGGEGARATLIGWGDNGFTADAAKTTFPLRIGPLAQFNLLYAVAFLRSPEELDAFSFARPDAAPKTDLERAVSINIFGKPYMPLTPSTRAHLTEPDSITYPTHTFSSRWTCVLDLDAHPAQTLNALGPSDPSGEYPSILPEPASPFPLFALNSSRMTTPLATAMYSGYSTPQSSAFAGSKKLMLGPAGFFGRNYKNLTPSRSSGMYSQQGGTWRDQSPMNSARSSQYGQLSSSALIGMQYLRSPTTYSAPPPPPPHTPTGHPLLPESDDGHGSVAGLPSFDVPVTPAYPAFPHKSMLPQSPISQGPIASQSQANVGASVEIRRERFRGVPSSGSATALLPPTPLPHVSGAFGEQRMFNKLQKSGVSGESIVVSVGLLPLVEDGAAGFRKRGDFVLGPDKIYPLDIFTLDIFVFNQSTWTRRFEVTCPEKRRRRRGGAETGVYGGGGEVAKKMGYPGVLPMDSRVRIGPLRPSACQSVRMDFLAVTPGVHSVETLTLTDIESGFSMNLRAVLDIVVHDPND